MDTTLNTLLTSPMYAGPLAGIIVYGAKHDLTEVCIPQLHALPVHWIGTHHQFNSRKV